MSKRIVKIEITNFKVFRKLFTIDLPQGQNLLLYGENGSGKSSLYKAFEYFFRQGIKENLPFSHNIHSDSVDGAVIFHFDEETPILDDNGTSKSLDINIASSKFGESQFKPYVDAASRSRGFLDYTRLLKVYYSSNDNDNLFLLFLELLKDYQSEIDADKRSIGVHYNDIITGLRSLNKRGTKLYKKYDASLTEFQKRFNTALKKTFDKANELLHDYFSAFEIEISYSLKDMSIPKIGKLSSIQILGELYVKVEKSGYPIKDYKDILNEARLSAFASCLYLAGIKTMPQLLDYKILFLDDIFIGLDMGNRLPLLRIIKNEFSDYQIFMTSYDHSWFEMARLHLGNNWHCVELYGIQEKLPSGHTVCSPKLIISDSDFERGCRYLHNQVLPDYPAAANYFRKYLEKIIPDGFTALVTYSKDMEPIPSFALTEIFKRAIYWASVISDIEGGTHGVQNIIRDLSAFLPVLLHPLSHFNPHTNPYVGELMEVESLTIKLEEALEALNLKNKILFLYNSGTKLEMTLSDTSGWTYKYTLELEEHLILYPNSENKYQLNPCPCYICYMQGINNNGIELKGQRITKSSKLYNAVKFDSIDLLINNTISYLEDPQNAQYYHNNVQVIRPAHLIEVIPTLDKHIKSMVQNQE